MMNSEKVVVVFRSRLRADVDLDALEMVGARMYELASAMPGFISYKDFIADDGESVSIVEFADAASLLAWRNHPEHQRVQQRGREEFMAEYRIQVCRPEREYGFSATD
jgi:heme-degrading monooxygenase HmoA